MDALSFQDFLPLIGEKLGNERLMEEMARGFYLLADPSTGTLTFESLKRSARLLGLDSMSDAEFREMIRMGDTNGSGMLNLDEFCVVMIRCSPLFLKQAEELLDSTLSCLDECYLQHDFSAFRQL